MTTKGSKRWWWIGGLTAVAVGSAYWLLGSSTAAVTDVPTFAVQRGNLQINVLQGGEIRALKNFEVKSEIEYPTKIMSLIPEGYLITEEDVKDGKVLVELDPRYADVICARWQAHTGVVPELDGEPVDFSGLTDER